MNKNIGTLVAACTLLTSSCGQEDFLDDTFAEEVDP